MRTLILTLLWLAVVSPPAYAIDWLSWRSVGSATFSWGPFTLYTSQLLTPEGRYEALNQDRALIITYQRKISSNELVDATRDQWQELGILKQEPQSETWLSMLKTLWPDVVPGSQLAFVFHHQQGQFWYRASAAQKTFTPLGLPQSSSFSRQFLAIWLSPQTQYPELRKQLIGEAK